MPLVPLLEHKNADFVRGKGGRRAWVQQQANAKKHREEERVLRATKMKNREEERELRATKMKHREEERELRATKKKHREEQMRTNLFIFEVGLVKAVLGCNEKMFLL